MEESKQPPEPMANMEPQNVESLLVALLEQMRRLTLHLDKHALLREQPQAQLPLNAQQRAANDWLIKYQIYYLPPVTSQEAQNVMENIVGVAMPENTEGKLIKAALDDVFRERGIENVAKLWEQGSEGHWPQLTWVGSARIWKATGPSPPPPNALEAVKAVTPPGGWGPASQKHFCSVPRYNFP